MSYSRPPMRAFLWLFLCVFVVLTWSAGVACDPKEGTETTPETVTEAAVEKANTEPQVSDAAPEKKPELRSEPVIPEAKVEPMPEPAPKETAQDTQPEMKVDTAPETMPEPGPGTKKVAFVVNTNFVNGSISVFDVVQQKLIQEITKINQNDEIAGDLVLRESGNQLFALHRFNSDTKQDRIDVFNKKTLQLISQVSLNPKANPHDCVTVGTRLYVSQYGEKELLVFESGKAPVSIDLSSLAETSAKSCTKDDDCSKFGEGSKKCDIAKGVCASDGLPEMTKMRLVGDKLYVLIQGLDRNDGFKPIKSVIAVVDTKTNTLSTSIPLKGTNPTDWIAHPNGTYLIPQQGSAFDAKDGGMEVFDPTTGKASGSFVFTEDSAGGTFSFSDIVVVSATLAYALINDASYKQSLISFNPQDGKKGQELLKGKSLSGLALHSNGKLYLGDKGDGAGGGDIGVRIFEASTGKELTTKPISVSAKLAPSSILFGEIAAP